MENNEELRKLFHRNYGGDSVLEVNLNLAKHLNLEVAGIICYLIDLESVTQSVSGHWYILNHARISSKFNLEDRLIEIFKGLIKKDVIAIKKFGPHHVYKLNYDKIYDLMYPEIHDEFDYETDEV